VNLRPYQVEAVAKLRNAWRQRPILQLATGGGKTVVAAEIIRSAVAKGKRCLIVAHTREIVLQTARRFAEYGFNVSTIMAGEPEETSLVYCGSIQTLARRELPAVEVVIIDEAHHANSPSWKTLIDSYPNAAVIGLTATPLRLDGRGLNEAGFGAIIQAATMEQLIQEGFLVRPRIYSVPVAAVDATKKTGGDYTQAALDDFSRTIMGNLVEHWKAYANGARTIVFACSIKHSRDIAEAFGDQALHVDGTMSKEERAEAIRRLSEGDIRVITNCSIFGEGWDLPVLECAVLARPTLSLALYRQQCGRVLRSSPGKTEAVILDHAGNFHRHGSPLDELDWSLDGKPKRRTDSPPGKTCPECYVVVHASAKLCPECGFVFDIKPREPDHVEGQLEEVKDSKPIRRAVYTNLCATAWTRGYKIGWARNQYRDRFKVWPRLMKDIEQEHFPCEQHEPQRTDFGTRCARCLRSLDPRQDSLRSR